jgi:CBS domain-containing protein
LDRQAREILEGSGNSPRTPWKKFPTLGQIRTPYPSRRVVTTASDTSLLDITKQLRMHGIGCIVITCSGGKVIGIVSERDIVREIARAGSKVLKEPVETCMTKAVVTCRESDTIDRLMAEMTAHRFRHMPVVERPADRPRLHR